MKIQNLKKSVRTKEDTVLQLTHDLKVLKVAIDNCSPSDMPNIRSLDVDNGGGGLGGTPHTRGRDPSKDPTVVRFFCLGDNMTYQFLCFINPLKTPAHNPGHK